MFSLYTTGGLPGNGIFQVYKWHVELGNILFLFLPAFLVDVSLSNSVITPSFSVHLGQSWLPAVNLSIARLWQFMLYNSWKLILMDTHTHILLDLCVCTCAWCSHVSLSVCGCQRTTVDTGPHLPLCWNRGSCCLLLHPQTIWSWAHWILPALLPISL